MSPRIDTLAVPVVPSTSSTAPVMADTTAIVGTATNMPVRPPIVNPIRRARRITAGCSWRVRLDRYDASRRCSTTFRTTTISTSRSPVGSPTERKTGEQKDPGHEEAADVRDESCSEDEHRQWPGERYADQGQDDKARHRINGRDHGGSAHVAARSAHRLLAGVPDPVALPAAKP